MIHNYMNPTKIFDSYLLKQLDVNSTKLYTCNNMEFYCTIFILVQITAQSHYSTLCLPVGVGQLRKISDRVRIALEDTCQGQDNLGRYPLRLGQHMFKNILLTLFRINVKFVGQKTSLFGIFILIFCLDFFFLMFCLSTWRGILRTLAFIELGELSSAQSLEVPFHFLDFSYILCSMFNYQPEIIFVCVDLCT